MYLFNKTWLVRLKSVWVIKAYAYKDKCRCYESGKWPFHLWFYRWGVAFHWGKIADARIVIKPPMNHNREWYPS